MKSAFIARVRSANAGFTIAEVLVSVFVLVLLTLMFTQLMTSATGITRTHHKQFDADTQARVVLDRMALDFAQMVKRIDVDYYVKQPSFNGHGNGHGCGQARGSDLTSDQIAFYSMVPAYNPDPSNFSSTKQSPLSLIAYRVNESNSAARNGRLERMSKGLLWNAVSNGTGNGNGVYYPIVYKTGQIDSNCNINSCPCRNTAEPWSNVWKGAVCNTNSNSSDPDYEVIGPGVFRFEYYYILKNGRITDWPWDRFDDTGRTSILAPTSIGLSRVEAIAVSIAVIDQQSRELIKQANAANSAYGNILDLADALPDFKNSCGRGGGNQKSFGDLERQWKEQLDYTVQNGHPQNSSKLFPPEAVKGIQVYNRYFDLKIW